MISKNDDIICQVTEAKSRQTSPQLDVPEGSVHDLVIICVETL